jgi:hypothetical protein
VEVGQLMAVAAAYLVYRAARSLPALALARTPALYAIGAVAAYWSIDRMLAIVA